MAALVEDGEVLATAHLPAGDGLAAALPPLVAALLGRAGPVLAAVAVVVGPGSFTGLRAGMALAHGLALGRGVALLPVTLAEALAEAMPSEALAGRAFWVATAARRDRVTLVRDGAVWSGPQAEIASPAGPVALAGEAANAVAARLAGRGVDVWLSQVQRTTPAGIALVARRREAGALAPILAEPLYGEAAAVTAGGPARPPPAG